MFKLNQKYRAQFFNDIFMEFLEIKKDLCLIKFYNKDNISEKEVDWSFVKAFNLREYDGNIENQKYEGPISKEDIESLQEFYNETLTEEMILDAIFDCNYEGDWNEVIENFGISGDTCNKEFVCECLEKKYDLKSLA